MPGYLESSHLQAEVACYRQIFPTKRDAEDRARRTDDEMVRVMYIERGASGALGSR